MYFWGKAVANVRKNRDIKLVTRERRRSYHTTKLFTKNLLAIEMKKIFRVL